MKMQSDTTDPTLVAILNWTAPGDVDPDTGLGVYYLGDAVVTARPVEATRNHDDFGIPTEWYIEEVN